MSENVQSGAPGATVVSHSGGNKRWYVVHAYSGMEKSVQRALTERILRAGMEDKFGQILVPTEEVIDVKNGQKSVTERRFFPGYVLVEMEMTDETWHLVKNTSKVTGFIGGKSNKPTPIPPHEVDKIMQQMQDGAQAAAAATLSAAGTNKRWYVVHAYSGMEKKRSTRLDRAHHARRHGIQVWPDSGAD